MGEQRTIGYVPLLELAPGVIASAALVSCSTCGTPLRGMGGPISAALCAPCTVTHALALPELAGKVPAPGGPVRIQLSRPAGWRLPPNTVVVARPSIFGNPFKVGELTAPQAVALFRAWLAHEGALDGYFGTEAAAMRERRRKLFAALPKLRGKNLACWCHQGAPCHVDPLLEHANA